MPLELGMKATLGIIIVTFTLVTFLLSFLGFKETEAGIIKTIEERAKEGFQKINDLMASKLSTDAEVNCKLNGGVYEYDVTVKDLNVFFVDRKRPDREISVMPVIKFKGRKALDSEKSFTVLKSGQDYTFGVGTGLNYKIISDQPPTIFYGLDLFYDYLLKNQRLIMNNFEFTVSDVKMLVSKCTVFVDVRCNNGFASSVTTLRLSLCTQEEPNACKATTVACNRGVYTELKEFRNKDSDCSAWEPIIEIDTSPSLTDWEDTPPLPLTNANDTLIIGFCEPVNDADECEFISGNVKFYGTMNIEIQQERYLVDQCIKTIRQSTAKPGPI